MSRRKLRNPCWEAYSYLKEAQEVISKSYHEIKYLGLNDEGSASNKCIGNWSSSRDLHSSNIRHRQSAAELRHASSVTWSKEGTNKPNITHPAVSLFAINVFEDNPVPRRKRFTHRLKRNPSRHRSHERVSKSSCALHRLCDSTSSGSDIEPTFAHNTAFLYKVLQYNGDHNSLGFWYEWIKYKDSFDKAEMRQKLHCGDSLPILWKDRKEGAILGYLDANEFAHFSHDGAAQTKQGTDVDNMWIIMRNTKGGPPTCDCKNCYIPPTPPHLLHHLTLLLGTPPALPPRPLPPPPKVIIDEWMDIRAGDPWPQRKLMKTLNKTLDTIPRENPDQFVALWYQAGEPIMSRIWNEGGKVAAAFGWFGKEYREKVGSLQVLVELADHVRGFDYKWVPYSECEGFGEKEWIPVYVDYCKGIISPAVINWEGKQILGKADMRNEKVSSPFKGADNVIVGPKTAEQLVLCRKPTKGYHFD